MLTHTRDADCTSIDPLTDLCNFCHVEHGDPCVHCRARAFHLPNCIVRVARKEIRISARDRDDQDQLPADPAKFAATRTGVRLGSRRVATAVSKTMAKRIANALNAYQPNREGA